MGRFVETRMSYDERRVSDLIGTVRTTYLSILENLANGNVASALRCMEKLNRQAEALYNSHLNSLEQHVDVAGPHVGCLGQDQPQPAAGRSPDDEPKGHGQDGR
jgi:hypothetical protein